MRFGVCALTRRVVAAVQKQGIASTSDTWRRMYDLVLTCGGVHDPNEFPVHATLQLRSLIPYDQALIFYLGANRTIVHHRHIDADPKWSRLYLDYYSKSLAGKFDLTQRVDERTNEAFLTDIRWDEEPLDSFIVDYVRPRELKESLAFLLFDLRSAPRIAVSLDRREAIKLFSAREKEMLSLVVAQLNNLYKNFYVEKGDIRQHFPQVPSLESLTPREGEVLKLLSQGLKPEFIGRELHIATSTAYKHIAHIYKKLDVSNKQELLVKVLRVSPGASEP